MPVKICSFNVNSVRARLPLIVEWLRHRGEDIHILCLQETKTVDKEYPARDFEKLGFTCRIFGQKGYNGVAICSRLPLENVRKGMGSPEWDTQRRVISAEAGGINLVNVYAPHGGRRGEEGFAYKLGWFRAFAAFLDTSFSPESPLLVLGDFNVALEDRDVFAPDLLEDSIGTTVEEREALDGLLEWGLTDAFRRLYPDRIQFTWWDYMGGAVWKNAGMRIDYVLVTRPLLERVKDVEVDLWPRRRRTPSPSDHAPVIVTLEASGS